MSDKGQKCPLCGSMVRTEGRELVPATERDEFMRWVMSMPEWKTMTAQELVGLWMKKIGSKNNVEAFRRGVEAALRADSERRRGLKGGDVQ